MPIQIIFPIIYCVVVVCAVILLCIDSHLELVYTGKALIILDFVALAILNYNCFYWVKVAFTLTIISFMLDEVIGHDEHPIIDRLAVLSFIATIIAGIIGLLVAGRIETVETTTEIVSLSDAGMVHGNGGLLTGILVDEHLCYSFYFETGENQFKQHSVPSENTTIHYIKDASDGVPRVIQKHEITSWNFKRYGKQVYDIEKDEHISAEIYVPEGSIVDSFILNGP